MSFIKSRLTKDNFWNLMFWLGMILGVFITSLIGHENPISAFISAWSTIIGVPLIVVKGSKITFNKELEFLDRNGASLKDRLPVEFGAIFFLTIGITAFLGFMLDGFEVNDTVSYALIFNTIFLIPTLYFIYKNCPIAILFNKHTWLLKVPDITINTYRTPHKFSQAQHMSSLSPSSWSTDPGYSHLSGNIHHQR